MNNIMILKIGTIILICLVTYIFLMRGILQDDRRLKKNYMDSIFKFTLRHNASYVVNTVRADSFFFMTNNGNNPCDLKVGIEYIDYINECNIYIERKTNDGNH